MNSVRLPGSSPSWVYGTVPAKTSTGARPRMALLTMPPMFWVPESTCTTTACGSPVTMAYAWAAESATVSCGQMISVGSSSARPSALAWARASMRPG